MAIVTGTEVGALLVDGLGDGLLIECPGEDVGQLRLMSFGLLQVHASQAQDEGLTLKEVSRSRSSNAGVRGRAGAGLRPAGPRSCSQQHA